MSVHIAIVIGAARPDNRTTPIAEQAASYLREHGATVAMLHPGVLELPLPGTGADRPGVRRLREALAAADAVVLATPEYQGSFSSVLKLALEHLGWPAELRGKPVALLGVAAGRIGAIKSLEHLRSVVAHLGGVALPQPVSIAQVHDGIDASGWLSRPGDIEALRALCSDLLDALGAADTSGRRVA